MEKPLIISVFSKEWYLANYFSIMGLVFLLCVSYLFINSNYVKENKISVKITKILGFLILLRFVLSQLYQIFTTPMVWDVNHSLPLHLCGISGIISGLILIKFNQFLYEFLLLLGAPGALWSFITPQINIPEPSFMYFDYFLSHTLILFTPLYLSIVFKKRPRVRSWINVFLKTNLILLPTVFFINAFLYYGLGYKDVNYIYLMRPPEAQNPFIVGVWPYYIVALQVVGFIHIAIIYYLFNNYNRFKNMLRINRRIA